MLAAEGCDTFTVSAQIAAAMFADPLTAQAAADFEAAAERIGAVGIETRRPALEALCKDADGEVRLAALRGRKKLGPRNPDAALVDLLADPHTAVRSCALAQQCTAVHGTALHNIAKYCMFAHHCKTLHSSIAKHCMIAQHCPALQNRHCTITVAQARSVVAVQPKPWS
mgnify:CR=1 FL=1